jgi:hypothetical protein
VAQRVDSFKFEELIGLKPLGLPVRRADEHRTNVMATTLRPEHYQDSETGNLIVP